MDHDSITKTTYGYEVGNIIGRSLLSDVFSFISSLENHEVYVVYMTKTLKKFPRSEN